LHRRTHRLDALQSQVPGRRGYMHPHPGVHGVCDAPPSTGARVVRARKRICTGARCSLRFLWLDHCQDQVISTVEEGDEDNRRRCFKRLWVLVMCATHLVIGSCPHRCWISWLDFMTQLRELNVIFFCDRRI
jgi:hypothetical protein